MNQPSFKKIAFLTPRADLSDEAFRRYWRETHGPVVANAPGYAEWRRRYVQNHVAGPGLDGAVFPFAGMAEFWLPDANEDRYALSPTYRDHVRPDELNFINIDRTVSMTAVEHVILPGRSDTKLIVLTSDGPEAGAHEAGDLAEVAIGYALNLVQPDSFRLPGGRSAPAMPVAAIHEIWLSSCDALASPSTRHAIASFIGIGRASHAAMSFLAEELVFFEDGQPIRAARIVERSATG